MTKKNRQRDQRNDGEYSRVDGEYERVFIAEIHIRATPIFIAAIAVTEKQRVKEFQDPYRVKREKQELFSIYIDSLGLINGYCRRRQLGCSRE